MGASKASVLYIYIDYGGSQFYCGFGISFFILGDLAYLKLRLALVKKLVFILFYFYFFKFYNFCKDGMVTYVH